MKNDSFDYLQAQGYKLTHQRKLVLAILDESQQHLDADSLFRLAKQRDPKVSLATVYRTLATLKKLGLVQEHDLGEDHGHFEIVTAKPHFHFTCSQCGTVFELRSKKIVRLTRELCAEEGLQMEAMHLLIQGLCAACQSQNSTSAKHP